MQVACHVAWTPGRLAFAVLRKTDSPPLAPSRPTWPVFQSPAGERREAGEHGWGECPVVLREGAGCHGDVLDASAVYKETVLALLFVVGVHERC